MEIQPSTAEHEHTIIFLHGYGSTAAELKLELFESQAADSRTLPQIFPHAKWIFPTSGLAVTRDGIQSQWFNMHTTSNPNERSEGQAEALIESVEGIFDLVIAEAKTVGPENVLLAGISQGGAVAIIALRRQLEPLGGFIGISSWFPAVATRMTGGAKALETPVFLAHCQNDGVIEMRYGEELSDRLKGKGMEVEWHQYQDAGKSGVDTGHWVNEPEGVDDIVKFVRRALKISE